MSGDPCTAAGWTMLHFLWVGAIGGVVAAVGRRLIAGAGPDARYAYALACLALLAIAPAAIAACLVGEVDRERPEFGEGAALHSGRAGGVSPPWPGPGARDHGGLTPPARPKRPSNVEGFGEPTPPARLGSVVAALPWLWVVGAPITFAWLAAGLVGAERLRRAGRSIENEHIKALARDLAASLGMAGRVGVALCDRIAAPVLVGIARPLILLPPAALTGWTPEQLQMALLHELAHVRRWDNLVVLVQRAIESALFFHPAVWVVSGWAHAERELCCDRIVARRTGRPRAYAEALLALADRPRPRSTALAMAEGKLVTRIRHLLITEEVAMKAKLPRTTVALAAVLLLAPAAGALAWVREPGRPTAMSPTPSQAIGQAAEAKRDVKPPAPPQEPSKKAAAPADDLKRRVAAEALAVAEHGELRDDPSFLEAVAMAQAAAGDREGATATMGRAVALIAGQPASWIKARDLGILTRALAEWGGRENAVKGLKWVLNYRGVGELHEHLDVFKEVAKP